jgi:hypothetical protein
MAEIPTEALEAAARALYNLRRRPGTDWWAVDGWAAGSGGKLGFRRSAARTEASAILAAAAPYLIAEGRRQRDAELFTAQPDASVDDETPALMARYERELRAKIAGEIRSANTDSWLGSRAYEVRDCQEQAARIVEAGSSTQREV